jgi:serine/threonine-protein kinase
MSGDRNVGAEIAGHRVLSVIGRGGMSVVYLAEHIRLGRKVALKILGPELAEDEAFRERFIRESRIAASLDHPNIVTVYDAGEADGVLYISMRYVEGTDLERKLRTETRLDPVRAIAIVSQSAAALDAAHAKGLVHRDVKPANILLTVDRRTFADHAYLSDFGVTKRMHTGARLTRTGQFVGTVDYVAPEQIRGDEVDGRADVYSLACVLYRCLTGEVPFPRDTEVATIYAHLQDAPSPPSERHPDLPASVDAPILRALEKSRDDRFDTARAFAVAAAAAIEPDRIPVAAGTAVVSAAGAVPSRASRHQAARRRRTALAATGVAVAAGLVIGVVLFSSHAPGRPRSSSPGNVPQLTWRPVADKAKVLDGPQSQVIVDVLPVGDKVLAFGHNDQLGDRDAAVWTSPNGRRWASVPGESFGRSGDQRIDDVADFEGQLVAVGSERAGGATDPAVWTSTDQGANWIRVPPVASGLHRIGDQGAMRAVAAAAPGLVAAGFQKVQGSLDAAIWTSTNGTDWNWVSVPSFSQPGDQLMLGATTFKDKLVVAGVDASQPGDSNAAIWVESAGTWTTVRSDALAGPGNQEIDAVIAGGPGLIAVGSDTSSGRSQAAVWTSTDARDWTRVPTGDVGHAGVGNDGLSSVSSLSQGFVAGGWSDEPGSDGDGAIWQSADGLHWTAESSAALGGLGRQQISTLSPLGGDRLLAAGSQRIAHDQEAAVWIATMAFRSPSPAGPASAS